MGRRRLLNKEQVLRAIQGWVISHGNPPTLEELREELNVGSTRTVHRYLQWLEEDGDIKRWPGARGIQILRRPEKSLITVPVPIVGEVPAGPLLLAEENHEGWVRLPRSFLRQATESYYLLRVCGDSMNRAEIAGGRIEDGDLVLVRQQPTADAGEVVVALIDGEATIKRLMRGPDYIVLKPESSNPAHRPIIAKRNLGVQGVVKRVLKNGSIITD